MKEIKNIQEAITSTDTAWEKANAIMSEFGNARRIGILEPILGCGEGAGWNVTAPVFAESGDKIYNVYLRQIPKFDAKGRMLNKEYEDRIQLIGSCFDENSVAIKFNHDIFPQEKPGLSKEDRIALLSLLDSIGFSLFSKRLK